MCSTSSSRTPTWMLIIYSPEDQNILETEYQRNSKPDKAARMAIMAQVSLDEKAIQVASLRAALLLLQEPAGTVQEGTVPFRACNVVPVNAQDVAPGSGTGRSCTFWALWRPKRVKTGGLPEPA